MALIDIGIAQVNTDGGIIRDIPHRLDTAEEFFITTVLGAIGCKIIFHRTGTFGSRSAGRAGIFDPAPTVFIHENTTQTKVIGYRRIDNSSDIAHLIGIFITFTTDGQLETKFIGRVGSPQVQSAAD